MRRRLLNQYQLISYNQQMHATNEQEDHKFIEDNQNQNLNQIQYQPPAYLDQLVDLSQHQSQSVEQISADVFKNIAPTEQKKNQRSFLKFKHIFFAHEQSTIITTQSKFSISEIKSLKSYICEHSKQQGIATNHHKLQKMHQLEHSLHIQPRQVTQNNWPVQNLSFNTIQYANYTNHNRGFDLGKRAKKKIDKKVNRESKMGKIAGVGKKRDKISNQVFNCIVDHFK